MKSNHVNDLVTLISIWIIRTHLTVSTPASLCVWWNVNIHIEYTSIEFLLILFLFVVVFSAKFFIFADFFHVFFSLVRVVFGFFDRIHFAKQYMNHSKKATTIADNYERIGELNHFNIFCQNCLWITEISILTFCLFIAFVIHKLPIWNNTDSVQNKKFIAHLRIINVASVE